MAWANIAIAGGSAAGAYFGSQTEDKKVEPLPRTPGSIAGERKLLELGTQPAPTLPTQGIAELTPIQKLIQSRLSGALSGIEGASQQATDYYSDLLSKDYDVTQDPRYLAAQREAGIEGRRAVTAANRGSERQGMLGSSGARQKALEEFQASSTSPLLNVLAQLLTERERLKAGAAQGITGAAGQKVQSLAAVGGIADEARAVEQAGDDAVFRQALANILFPYQYQAGIATSLMNFQPGLAVTGGGLSDTGRFASAAGPFFEQVAPLLLNRPATGGVTGGGTSGGGATQGGNTTIGGGTTSTAHRLGR